MYFPERLYSFFYYSLSQTTFFGYNTCIFPIHCVTLIPHLPFPFVHSLLLIYHSPYLRLLVSCLFLCSFLLVFNNLYISPTYTAFLYLHRILYTTPFCFSSSGCCDRFFSFFIFVPGLNAI